MLENLSFYLYTHGSNPLMLISGSVCVTSDCFIDDILPRVQRPAFIYILLSIFGISTWLCVVRGVPRSHCRHSLVKAQSSETWNPRRERANAGWVGVIRVRRRHLVGALNDYRLHSENHPASGWFLAGGSGSLRPTIQRSSRVSLVPTIPHANFLDDTLVNFQRQPQVLHLPTETMDSDLDNLMGHLGKSLASFYLEKPFSKETGEKATNKMFLDFLQSLIKKIIKS